LLTDDPKGWFSPAMMLGHGAAKALAAVAHLSLRRMPLARARRARKPNRQGHSTGHIARTLQTTDVSVRKGSRIG